MNLTVRIKTMNIPDMLNLDDEYEFDEDADLWNDEYEFDEDADLWNDEYEFDEDADLWNDELIDY